MRDRYSTRMIHPTESHLLFQVDMAQENFEKISRIIRKEFEAFDIKKCQDFKQTILQYLEQMLK